MALSVKAGRPATKARTKKGRVRKSAARATHDEIRSYYRDMLMIRRFEEKAGQLHFSFRAGIGTT